MKRLAKFYIKIIIVLLGLISFPNVIFGAEDGTITCTITTTNILFSPFNPYDATPESANGTSTVKCTNSGTSSRSVSYYVTYSYGSSGDVNPRTVRNGTNVVNYNIYKNATYSQYFGVILFDGAFQSNSYTLARNGSRTDNYTIYGRIPIQPLARPMTYTDSLISYVYYDY